MSDVHILFLGVRTTKLIYFVSVDWFFRSHFLARAIAAKEAGYEVVVVTSISGGRSSIENTGLRIIHLLIDRKSLNPFSAISTVIELISLFRREKPDILHQVALKPILLGGLAARIAGVKRVVNAVVGAGYAFTSGSLFTRILRPIFSVGLKLFLNPPGSRVIFENKDDLTLFVTRRYVHRERAVLIRGAGVNVNMFKRAAPNTPPLVVVAARLLWDKGLGEFVGAARLLRNEGVIARFVIVGGTDLGNRASIPAAVLKQWRTEGFVELWGFQSDMQQVFARADIVCLPSYREGLPKALLEGMAAGLPCVTTDVPGCREAVRDGDNGLLVPAKDMRSLATAIQTLLNNPKLARKMGERGRQRVELEFSEKYVNESTLKVYQEMLAK